MFSGTDPDSGTSYADEEDFHVVPAPDDADVEPDVVVDGPAAALDLWLWNRGDDADISIAGRPGRARRGSRRSWRRRSTDDNLRGRRCVSRDVRTTPVSEVIRMQHRSVAAVLSTLTLAALVPVTPASAEPVACQGKPVTVTGRHRDGR